VTEEEGEMATEKQKAAAKRNVKKAAGVSASRRTRDLTPTRSRHPLSSTVESGLKSTEFAFPKQRKEPLTDAKHVRNAIARFDQVEGVSDSERDAAWRRIKSAAKKHDIEVSASSWRHLT
jgi:hypothetical protein